MKKTLILTLAAGLSLPLCASEAAQAPTPAVQAEAPVPPVAPAATTLVVEAPKVEVAALAPVEVKVDPSAVPVAPVAPVVETTVPPVVAPAAPVETPAATPAVPAVAATPAPDANGAVIAELAEKVTKIEGTVTDLTEAAKKAAQEIAAKKAAQEAEEAAKAEALKKAAEKGGLFKRMYTGAKTAVGNAKDAVCGFCKDPWTHTKAGVSNVYTWSKEHPYKTALIVAGVVVVSYAGYQAYQLYKTKKQAQKRARVLAV